MRRGAFPERRGGALFVGKKALVVFLFSSSWIGIVP